VDCPRALDAKFGRHEMAIAQRSMAGRMTSFLSSSDDGRAHAIAAPPMELDATAVRRKAFCIVASERLPDGGALRPNPRGHSRFIPRAGRT
jgi:hypothetical protein